MACSIFTVTDMTRRIFIAAGLFAAVLGACSDEKEASAPPRAEAGQAAAAPHKVKWLELNAGLSPEQWLASRNEDRVRPETDQEVVRIGGLLDSAHRLYRESRRMIANRAVQVEGMLETAGAGETAVSILEELASLAGEVGQTEGFGAISQHYVNLRSSGHDRSAAVARLKALYGTRR
jgi:hypothetical protein